MGEQGCIYKSLMLSDNVQAYTVHPYLTLLPKKPKKIENVIFDMNNIKDKNLMKPTIATELRLIDVHCSRLFCKQQKIKKKIHTANSRPKSIMFVHKLCNMTVLVWFFRRLL